MYELSGPLICRNFHMIGTLSKEIVHGVFQVRGLLVSKVLGDRLKALYLYKLRIALMKQSDMGILCFCVPAGALYIRAMSRGSQDVRLRCLIWILPPARRTLLG